MKHSTLKKILMLTMAAVMLLAFTGCVGAEGGSEGGSLTTMIIPMVLLVVFFYFFMIRPENKKKKEAQKMRDELAVGDKVTTIGGMVGKVVNIKDDTITFETGEDRVRVQIMKWGISTTGKGTDPQETK